LPGLSVVGCVGRSGGGSREQTLKGRAEMLGLSVL